MHAVKVHETLCRIFPDDSPCRGCLNTLVKQRVIKLTPNVGAFMKLNYAVFVKETEIIVWQRAFIQAWRCLP